MKLFSYYPWTSISAVIMANETDPVLIKAVKWLQLRQESLKDGFVVDYKGGEYIFVPEYIDRFGKISNI